MVAEEAERFVEEDARSQGRGCDPKGCRSRSGKASSREGGKAKRFAEEEAKCSAEEEAEHLAAEEVKRWLQKKLSVSLRRG